MKITIEDSIFCKASKDLIPHIRPCLKYKSVYWRQDPFRRERKTADAFFIVYGKFLAGLLPKVIDHLQSKNIDFEIKGRFKNIIPTKDPKDFFKPLLKKGFRKNQVDLQINLINKAIEKQRGIVLAPTAFGKSIVFFGLLSTFPKSKILILCHSIDIVNQIYDDLIVYNKEFDDCCVLGGGKKDWKGHRIVVSTIQTFVKFNPDDYCEYFDVTIIDEVHHVNNRKSQYGQVMQSNLSPMRIGFTATLPKEKEKLLSLEGLLGPVIGEVTIKEASEKGIIAKPKIKLIPVPYNINIAQFKSYKDLYKHGIVENRARNKLIAWEARELSNKGKTVLIMIKEIKHGEFIQSIGKDIFGLDMVFVQGSTEGETRTEIKRLLDDKKIKVVISSSVWKEGVNIPTLSAIINGMGGMSSIQTVQVIGRGLRIAEGKDSVIIIDFLDQYKYLAEHAIKRITIYAENGWEMSGVY
ncbi:hypothetical protein LCGC14_0458650 [marine sediment metagenome]|uniref:Helicase ATP-binding domain-containing protein n=1 Tax=marine sediment metagenome TaxID=412755 RepID=A0A0F9SYK1_9ZZZZ